MAILPVPTIPDPDSLQRIRRNVMDVIAPVGAVQPPNAVVERIARDDRLAFQWHIEFLSLRQLQRLEFMRYLVRAGLYSEEC